MVEVVGSGLVYVGALAAALGAINVIRPLGWMGVAAAFAALSEPGFVKAGMNFLMEDEGGGWTRLTTETRVHTTDAEGRRRFAAYWRAIYPGSALIRRMWLRAIKARAEREEPV